MIAFRMKTLSPDEIECLLGVQLSIDHPLDILGYGYTSEGVRRFRNERPCFLPQIVEYVRSVLTAEGIFPRATDPNNPGLKTFIRGDRGSFSISSMEEIRYGKYQRLTTDPMSESEAIHTYIRLVANPDYIYFPAPQGASALEPECEKGIQ